MIGVKIDIKKVILAGIAATIVGTAIGFICCGWLFNWVYQLEPTSVWKPMDQDFGSWIGVMFFGGLVLNIILAKVYAIIHKSLPGPFVRKGLIFGLMVWSVGTLPGMFATYMTMVVAETVIWYWLFEGLLKSVILGIVIAAIYKE